MVPSSAAIDHHHAGRGPAASSARALRRRSAGAAAISRGSHCSLLLLFAAVLAVAAPAAVVGPATVVLDFEGVLHNQHVVDFYAGGAGGPSKDYGVTFGGTGYTMGAVDDDVAGVGFAPIANEPSPSTVAFVDASADRVVSVTVPGGFTAMSFQYTTDSAVTPTVTVYDGPGLSGNVLGNASFPATGLCASEGPSSCGDPTGTIGLWKNVTVTFSGVARSAGFRTAFYLDDMMITLAPPTTSPPTNAPTSGPTSPPTKDPTSAPTQRPRRQSPTNGPTRFPTKAPTTTSACRVGRKGMKGNMKGCMKKMMM